MWGRLHKYHLFALHDLCIKCTNGLLPLHLNTEHKRVPILGNGENSQQSLQE